MNTPDDLATALAARVEAHARHREAVAVSARADAAVDVAKGAVEKFDEAESTARERHIEHLERWFVDGNSGAPPAVIVDPSERLKKLAAQDELHAAEAVAARLQSNVRDRWAQVQAADKHVAQLMAQARRAQMDELARRRRANWEEDDYLARLMFAGELHGGRESLTPEALDVMQSPPTRLTPDTLISGGRVQDLSRRVRPSPHVMEEAGEYWREFDAALERGDGALAPASTERAA